MAKFAKFWKKTAKQSAIFNENFEIRDRCKGVHCVDLGESFPTKAAIAAKEAQEAAAATAKAAKVAQAAAAAQLKVPSKVRKGLDIRGDVYTDAGAKKVWCLKCKKGINYSGWSTHCSEHHPVQSSDVDKLGKVDDDDDGVRKDDGIGQLKCSDAGLLCAGISDAVSTQNEGKAAAPGRRQKATSRDKGAKKARVAPKGK